MNRGARRAPVFDTDEVRELFLDVLSVLPQRFGVRVHGYALMPNHYHLMLESVTGKLPRAMRHLGGEFTRRLNRKRTWDGPVFRGRYHNRIVDSDAYWRHLLVYTHLNPVKAGLSELEVSEWTSHQAYTGTAERPEWLTTADLQAQFGSEGGYLDYYTAVADDRHPAPADFDPDRLWAPNSTGTTYVHAPEDTFLELQRGLAAVSELLDQPVESLLTSSRGRGGNPSCWLAAWWLSRGCGVDHGRIAAAMGTTHSVVSRRIRKAEERICSSEQFRDWSRALMENGNT